MLRNDIHETPFLVAFHQTRQMKTTCISNQIKQRQTTVDEHRLRLTVIHWNSSRLDSDGESNKHSIKQMQSKQFNRLETQTTKITNREEKPWLEH